MSFSDYMASLGATRAPTPAERDHRAYGRNEGYVDMDNNSPGSRRSANYAYGSKFVPLTPGLQSRFDHNAGRGDPIGDGYTAGIGGSRHSLFHSPWESAFKGSEGQFLGYGNTIADLQNTPGNAIGYSDYTANEPVRLQQLETQRLANEQAALNLQRQRAAARQQNVPQFTGGGLMGLGQGQGPQTQRAPQARQVQGMHRGGAQGLLGGGLHRGTGPTGGGQ